MTPDDFLRRMVVLYGAPDTADDALFIDEYLAMIGTPNPRVLAVAFSIIRDEHEFKSWPTPAVVKKAISSADLRVHGPYRPEGSMKPDNPRANASPQSRKRVDDLVSGMVEKLKTGGSEAPTYPFVGVQRPGFEAMQRNSPNQYMHRKPSRNGRAG